MSEGKVRLYVKGVVMGYKRGLRNQYASTSLIKMEHVKDKDAAMAAAFAFLRENGAFPEDTGDSDDDECCFGDDAFDLPLHSMADELLLECKAHAGRCGVAALAQPCCGGGAPQPFAVGGDAQPWSCGCGVRAGGGDCG